MKKDKCPDYGSIIYRQSSLSQLFTFQVLSSYVYTLGILIGATSFHAEISAVSCVLQRAGAKSNEIYRVFKERSLNSTLLSSLYK